MKEKAQIPATIPTLPQYPPGMAIADHKQQKPLLKILGKMLKPKMAQRMKLSTKSLKNKHKVHFY